MGEIYSYKVVKVYVKPLPPPVPPNRRGTTFTAHKKWYCILTGVGNVVYRHDKYVNQNRIVRERFVRQSVTVRSTRHKQEQPWEKNLLVKGKLQRNIWPVEMIAKTTHNQVPCIECIIVRAGNMDSETARQEASKIWIWTEIEINEKILKMARKTQHCRGQLGEEVLDMY